MSARYWKIIATEDYIDVVSQLSVEQQENIQRQWIEVSQNQDPRKVGETADCGAAIPYVLVIFPGVPFEFVYAIKAEVKEIWLLSCKQLDFLDHGKTEFNQPYQNTLMGTPSDGTLPKTW